MHHCLGDNCKHVHVTTRTQADRYHRNENQDCSRRCLLAQPPSRYKWRPVQRPEARSEESDEEGRSEVRSELACFREADIVQASRH
jgi:hypothetical protein